MAILQAIVAGQRDGEALSLLVHKRVRKSKKEIADAIKKTLIWFFWNLLFGLAPFLFMILFNFLTDGKAHGELINLSEGGAVLFVFIAITGSVVVDILLGSYGFKNLNRFLLEIAHLLC